MSAEVRLRRLQQLVLDPGFLGLEPLLDLLLGVHQELGASDLAQDKYVADFLQWGECLPAWVPQVGGAWGQGRGRRWVRAQWLIVGGKMDVGEPPIQEPKTWPGSQGCHAPTPVHPGRAGWGQQRLGQP